MIERDCNAKCHNKKRGSNFLIIFDTRFYLKVAYSRTLVERKHTLLYNVNVSETYFRTAEG